MSGKSNTFNYWNNRYQSEPVKEMAWFFEPLDPDFEDALKNAESDGKRILDLGSGPGTQAMRLAELGYEVVASDISQAALDQAQKKALQNNLKIQFIHDNILQSQLSDSFYFIFDRGCFHVLPPEKREIYVRTVSGLLDPGCHLYLKCFSVLEPGTAGPYRISENEINLLFKDHFVITSIKHTVYQGPRKPQPRAIFCVLQRKTD